MDLCADRSFIDKDEFKKQIDEWIHVFRNTKPGPGTNDPLIPGGFVVSVARRHESFLVSSDGQPLLRLAITGE
jgi:hypothetical protein